MHNIIFGNVPSAISCSFKTVNRNNTRTRNINHFEELFTSKVYGTRTVFWLGPRLWNQIIAPKFPEIDNVPSSKQLIKQITKEHILSTYVE